MSIKIFLSYFIKKLLWTIWSNN